MKVGWGRLFGTQKVSAAVSCQVAEKHKWERSLNIFLAGICGYLSAPYVVISTSKWGFGHSSFSLF